MKVLAKGNAKKNRYESTTKATIPTSTLDYMLHDYRNPVCIPTSTLDSMLHDYRNPVCDPTWQF